MSINDVQSLLQGAETLALEIVDITSNLFRFVYDFHNSCGLGIEFASERLLAILYGDGITAFRVGRDVDVEADDVACVDGFLVDDFARVVSYTHLISIVERVKIYA